MILFLPSISLLRPFSSPDIELIPFAFLLFLDLHSHKFPNYWRCKMHQSPVLYTVFLMKRHMQAITSQLHSELSATVVWEHFIRFWDVSQNDGSASKCKTPMSQNVQVWVPRDPDDYDTFSTRHFCPELSTPQMSSTLDCISWDIYMADKLERECM